MLFNSYEFLIFFPIVLILYFFIPNKYRYILLLIASYIFYMGWNPTYALLIAFSTFATWLGGILFERTEKKKQVLFAVLGVNLSILFFFKYFNFLIDNVSYVTQALFSHEIESKFDIILPVGISFYTFQALGYTIDVYRGNVKAEKNFFRYALFVSFFPQLVAGPIERTNNLLKQIQNVENINLKNANRIRAGFVTMLYGYFLKMVVADRAAIVVNTIFEHYFLYGSIELVLGAILFGIQIYCDFNSYSLIAIGAAKVMGFELMENFRAPYFAVSIKDFWRRWHISLSTWFRDYVYIPLGGNRCSLKRKNLNLMVTFLISGLWHGANWGFVLWGGLHGAYQIIGEATKTTRDRINTLCGIDEKSFGYRLGKVIITFNLVCFAWIFFRTKYVTDGINYVFYMFTRFNPWVLFDGSLYKLGLSVTSVHVLIVSLVVVCFVDLIREKRNETIDVFLVRQPFWFRITVLCALFIFIAIYGVYGPSFSASEFIYFQF